MFISFQWLHKTCNISTADTMHSFHSKKKKVKISIVLLYDCIYKMKVLFQKAGVMLEANLVWLAWPSDLLVNIKPGICQPEHKKQMNPGLCSLVFNVFIKPAIFQQLIECLVSQEKNEVKIWIVLSLILYL